MAVIPILIVVSVLVALIFLIAFFWAVKSGQYEDTHSPAVRILFDDKPKQANKEETEDPKNTDKK